MSCGAGARGSTSTTTLHLCVDCLEPFASKHDEWKVGALRTEWWKSCVLPVNWKLATAAFMEGYHVPQTHPQLLPSSHSPEPSSVHPLIETSLHFMRTLGSGMGGMTHENDIRIAEGLQHMSLPDDPAEAMAAWRARSTTRSRTWHRARGCDFPDLNDLERRRVIDAIGFCFPHYFLLPQYSSASSYRIRPLGPRGDAVRDLVADPLSRTTSRRAGPRRPSRWRPTTRAGR